MNFIIEVKKILIIAITSPWDFALNSNFLAKGIIKCQTLAVLQRLTTISAKLWGGRRPLIGVSSRQGPQTPSHWWIVVSRRWSREGASLW